LCVALGDADGPPVGSSSSSGSSSGSPPINCPTDPYSVTTPCSDLGFVCEAPPQGPPFAKCTCASSGFWVCSPLGDVEGGTCPPAAPLVGSPCYAYPGATCNYVDSCGTTLCTCPQDLTWTCYYPCPDSGMIGDD
jgi:hypothetical protein